MSPSNPADNRLPTKNKYTILARPPRNVPGTRRETAKMIASGVTAKNPYHI
jgi:hypothetical protein